MTKQQFLDLIPTKSPTVKVVGEQYHKEALRRTPGGRQRVELVLEPNNPYDPFAISVRYDNCVIGYIPRERTERYWSLLARVAASGFTPRAVANIYKNPANNYFDVSLFLSNSEKNLPRSPKLPENVDLDNIPLAYSPREIPPTSAFTEEDRKKEKARREKFAAARDAQGRSFANGQLNEMMSTLNHPEQSDPPAESSTPDTHAKAEKERWENIGCGLAFAFIAVMVILLIIL